MRRAVVVMGLLGGALALGACAGEEDENDVEARDGGSAEGSATGGTGGGSGGAAGGGGLSGSAGSGGSAATGGSAGSSGASGAGGSAGSGGVAGTGGASGGAGMAGSGGMAGGSAVERVTYSYGMRNVTELNGTWYHAYYQQEPGTGEWDVYVRTSSDGSTWSSGVLVNTTIAGGQTRPNIVAWDDAGTARVAVSYVDESAAMPRMYSAVSSDGAQTFTETIAVDTAAENQELRGSMDRGTDPADRPVMRRSADGTLHVAGWVREAAPTEEWDLYYSRSTDDGATWSGPVQVNDPVDTGRGKDLNTPGTIYSSMAIGGNGRIYLVWADDREAPSDNILSANYDIYMSYSTDDGATWSSDQRINGNPSVLEQVLPSVAAAPGATTDTVVTVWNHRELGTSTLVSDARTLP